MQDIYLDANVWNLVFDNKIDLIYEFPKSKFRLLQTREAEFENNAIPEDKSDLKEFIQKEIERCKVQTIRIFGFEDSSTPDNERRFGGFEKSSVWITSKEKGFRDEQKEKIGKLKKSKLYNNEACLLYTSPSPRD